MKGGRGSDGHTVGIGNWFTGRGDDADVKEGPGSGLGVLPPQTASLAEELKGADGPEGARGAESGNCDGFHKGRVSALSLTAEVGFCQPG